MVWTINNSLHHLVYYEGGFMEEYFFSYPIVIKEGNNYLVEVKEIIMEENNYGEYEIEIMED